MQIRYVTHIIDELEKLFLTNFNIKGIDYIDYDTTDIKYRWLNLRLDYVITSDTNSVRISCKDVGRLVQDSTNGFHYFSQSFEAPIKLILTDNALCYLRDYIQRIKK